MIHIEKEELYFKRNKLSDQLVDEASIFFDIETTGFSPKHSHIYLIGCARKIGENIRYDQFFAGTPAEEKEVLLAFLDILKDYSTIISFNGVGFDVPFIKAKCDLLNIKENLKDFAYLDIFKAVSEIKFLLKLPNYKQKTIENYLGLERDDQFSGGELINVYLDYVKKPNKEAENLLLLHNYEDLVGMTELLPVLTYLEVFHGQYSIRSTEVGTYKSIDGTLEKELLITLTNDYSVPKRVSYQYQDFYVIMKDTTTTIRIPVFSGELHYFYPNYKDYYYLPQEDVAIHKSVATYVDKGYRENAKASNCYTRKEGEFLPQFATIMQPEFKKEHKDARSYFELNEDFYSSDIMLRRYTDHILQLMLSSKK